MIDVVTRRWQLHGLLLTAVYSAVFWLMVTVGSHTLAEEPVVLEGVSRFDRIVANLSTSPDKARAEFSSIALGRLVEIYLAESDLALNEARNEPRSAKLLGWASAVDDYAEQILLVMDDVTAGYPVELFTLREGTSGLSTGGRMILFTHPRPGQQRLFEQRVLSEYCQRASCVTATASQLKANTSIPLSGTSLTASWNFTRAGPLCFNDRLNVKVQFSSTDKLARLRAHCTQLFHEVSILLGELNWHQRHGTDVDFSALVLEATPGQPEHLIRLNRSGDSALMSLPLLYGSPTLLALLIPSLKALMAGADPAPVFIEGAKLGWESFPASGMLAK